MTRPNAMPGAPVTARLADSYDEMVTGQRAIRRHWQPLLSVVNSLPGEGLAERMESARRLIEEEGANYNLYSDSGAEKRRWSFDLLPLIIQSHEWTGIASAMAQRARLMNAMLNDIYGPQKLLHERLLPPSIVFNNPEFLRPCHDPSAPEQRPLLHFYAADLVRLPSGEWVVLSDRAELAAGVGYALENRRVQARTLPEAFRSYAVSQQRPFFDLWQSLLQQLAPAADNPHVALLTPGHETDAYFEHLYLARSLGLTLVEGADLALRDGRIAMKTLEGLKPVDVILRRVRSGLCDPLELQSDSHVGVVGMLQAARSGTIALANGIGAGVIETPALLPFLPGLAKSLLGEDLAIPSVEMLWCGQASALEHVLRDLPNYVIRHAFASHEQPTIVENLDSKAMAELADRIRERPWDYVAQRSFVPSVAPTWTTEGLIPHPIIMRVFLVRDGEDYVAMPGGHARVPMTHESFFRSPLQHRGISKDVWVLAEERADVVIPATTAGQHVSIQRSGAAMPSRVADNLFWLGRYAERLDNGARLLRAALGRLASGTLGPRDMIELRTIAQALESFRLIDSVAAQAPPDSRILATALTRAAGPNQPLQYVFREIHRLAASTRDRLSMDMWHAINQVLGEARGRIDGAFGDIDRLIASFDDLIRFAAIMAGMASENMTRGAGWRFLDIGRRIERGIFTAEGAMGAFSVPHVNWESGLRLALELCDSTITYRSRYLAAVQPAPVLDLVLADDSNPRSLAFQLVRLQEHLSALPRRDNELTILPVTEITGDLAAVIRMFDSPDMPRQSDNMAISMLRDLLEEASNSMRSLSDAITRAYFTHVPAAQALGSIRPATRA